MDDLLSSLSDVDVSAMADASTAGVPPVAIAQVILDLKVAHLDQVMDYLIPEGLIDSAKIGVKVKVPLAHSEVLGWIVGIKDSSEYSESLRPISRVVSLLPVLSSEVLEVAQRLAQSRVSTVAHVLRSAIPKRYAGTEKSVLSSSPPDFPKWESPTANELYSYQGGQAFLSHVSAGNCPRALWSYLPSIWDEEAGGFQHWLGIVAAVQACLSSSRAAVVVAPTAVVAEGLARCLESALPGEPIARLHQDLRPAARYRAHLDAISGHVRVVVGTRNAVYAPVQKLGLLVVLDPLDSRLTAQRSPYTPAWEVAALRSVQASAALLFAGLLLPAWSQRLLDSGWAARISPQRHTVRARTALIRVPDDFTLERDGASAFSRLPSSAFNLIKSGLEKGPVLVHVERGGYSPSLACASCLSAVRCPHCSGPVVGLRDGYRCTQCGQALVDFSCPACEGKRIKSLRVGAERTAEEFGRAFPKVPIVVSSAATRVIEQVDSRPRIVIATSHAAPFAKGGFSAAVILDPLVALNGRSADASEQAVGTWFAVASRVRPDGQVLLSGQVAPAYSQALVQWNPSRYTQWQYEQYAQAQLSPAWWTATVLGSASAVNRIFESVNSDESIEFEHIFGPFPALDDLAEEALRVLNEPNALVVHYCVTRDLGLVAAQVLRSARSLASVNDDDKVLIRVH